MSVLNEAPRHEVEVHRHTVLTSALHGGGGGGVIFTPGRFTLGAKGPPTDWLDGLRSQSGRFWEGKNLLALPSEACSLAISTTEYGWLNCAAMDQTSHNTHVM